jgi:hypothetical protein
MTLRVWVLGIVAAVLAGCAVSPSAVPPPSLPSGTGALAAVPHRVPPRRHPKRGVEKDLFVSDGANSVFEFDNAYHGLVGTITGLHGADGVWVDKKGSLYVANTGNGGVTEYKKGRGTPVCTYSSSMIDPVSVTTDDAGDVYVADYNHGLVPGRIDRFPQCKDTIAKEYDIAGSPLGVAVDAKNDIFVSYQTPSSGHFLEFKRGRTKPTPLGATVTFAAGLIVDKNGVLIADDQAGSIDTIAPPYAQTRLFASGVHGPLHASLNKSETLLFNANVGLGLTYPGTVTIYSYSSKILLETITQAEGIDGAYGVADSPNAVF